MSGFSGNLIVSGAVHAFCGLLVVICAGHAMQAEPERLFSVALISETAASAGEAGRGRPPAPRLQPKPQTPQSPRREQPAGKEPQQSPSSRQASPARPSEEVPGLERRLGAGDSAATGNLTQEAAASRYTSSGSSTASGSPAVTGGASLASPAGSGNPSAPDPLALIRLAIERNLVYPLIAQRKRIEGTVVLSFQITGQGQPEGIRIIRGSGHAMLDSAARETIAKASPYPAVNGIIEIPVTFRLAGRAQ